MAWTDYKDTSGRQPVAVVRIYLPTCAREYGVNECEATGTTGAEKCFNTFKTCQFRQAFTVYGVGVNRPSTYLQFSTRRIDNLFANYVPIQQQDVGKAPTFPTLRSVSTFPTELQAGRAIPNRGSIDFAIQDGPWSEAGIDPYLDERGVNYLDGTRGTLFQRMLGRYFSFEGMRVELFTGFLDENSQFSFDNCTKRTYYIEKAQGPDANGVIKFRAKDPLYRLANGKETCPVRSWGRLAFDLDSSIDYPDSSFDIFLKTENDPYGNPVINQYVDAYNAGQPYVKINSEYFLVIAVDAGSYKLTVNWTRAPGTAFPLPGYYRDPPEVASHEENDVVQICHAFNDRIDQVVYDLATTFGKIDPSLLDFAEWQAEADTWAPNLTLTRLIGEPTAVDKLLESVVQLGVSVWWQDREIDPITNKARLRFQILKPTFPTIEALDEDKHILAPGLIRQEEPEKRISQVYIRLAPISPDSENEAEDFRQTVGYVDALSGSELGFNSDKVLEIYSPWLSASSAAEADTVAARFIQLYRYSAEEYKLRLDAKDSELWTGDDAGVKTRQIRAADGTIRAITCRVISSKEILENAAASYEYLLEASTYTDETGEPVRLGVIPPDEHLGPSFPEYASATQELRDIYFFITEEDGTMPNGDPGYVIA